MAPASTAVRNPKGPAEPPTGPRAGEFLRAYLDSSVGGKVTVGLTGLGLVGFVFFHMIGNLKILPGGPESRESINAYAHFLKHGLGAWLWIARGVLLTIFVLHLFLAIRLALRSRSARPVKYAYVRTAQAGVASRTMMWTGIIILLFTLFHLAHYTFAVVKRAEVPDPATGQISLVNYLDLRDPAGRHDVYEMTVAGFTNVPIAVFYLVSQVILFAHLRHGIPSTFQTLGIKNARFRGPIDLLGLALALVILVGNCALVLAVQLGYVTTQYRTV